MPHARTVVAQLAYEPHLAGGTDGQYASETRPYLHMHLTHDLSGVPDTGPVAVIPSGLLQEHVGAPGSFLQVELPLVVDESRDLFARDSNKWGLGTRQYPPHTLPSTASLVVHTYVQTATETGQTCENHAGSAYFGLHSLLSSDGDRVQADWEFTGNEGPLVKGLTRLHSLTVRDGGVTGGQRANVVFAAPSDRDAFHVDDDSSVVDASLVTAGRARMEQALTSSLDVFFAKNAPLKKSSPAYLSRVHFPYFQNDINVIPGSALALLRSTAPSDPGVFTESLRVALHRNNVTAEHMSRAIAKQASSTTLLPEFRYAMKVMVSMLTVHANTIVYLDDFTNASGDTLAATSSDTSQSDTQVSLVRASALKRSKAVEIGEDYKVARFGGGGDCEDSATEVYMTHWDLYDADLSALDAAPVSTLLRQYQTVLKQHTYVPTLVGAAVTNKKQDVNVRDMGVDDAMGHTYYAAIPTAKFLDSLSEGPGQFGGVRDKVLQSSYATTYTGHRKPFHADLDVLIGEGTTRSDPFAMPITTFYPDKKSQNRARATYKATVAGRAALFTSRTFPTEAVMEVPNKHTDDANGDFAANRADVSPFYKGNSALYVSAFRDVGILDFALAKDPVPGPVLSRSATHGVHFTQFVQQKWSREQRIVPYNALQPEVRDYVTDTIAQLEPVPPLRRRNVRDLPVPKELAQLPKQLGTLTPAPQVSRGMPLPADYFTLQVRAQDATPQVVSSLTQVIMANKKLYRGARVDAVYLSDPPVHGDETDVPATAFYEISLGVRT